jgi:hypothetical protein
MPLTPTSTNDGIVLTDLSVAIPELIDKNSYSNRA